MCGAVLKVLKPVAKSMEGVVKFGITHYNDHFDQEGTKQILVYHRFNVMNSETRRIGIPSMIVLPYGIKASKETEVVLPPETLSGMFSEGPRAVFDNLKAFLPSKSQELTSPAVLRNFLAYRPESYGRERVLIVTSRPLLSVPARKLTLDFHRRADFGTVVTTSASSSAASTAMWELLPGVENATALYVSKRKSLPRIDVEAADSIDPRTVTWIKYDGEQAYAKMHDWLDKQLPPAPLKRAASQSDVDEHCIKPGGTCFFALLPALHTATGREYEAVFHELASRAMVTLDVTAVRNDSLPQLADLQARFLVLDGSRQEAFREAFETGIPGFIAINPSSLQYASYRGPLHVEALRQFVIKVLDGRQLMHRLEEMPPIEDGSFSLDDRGPKVTAAPGFFEYKARYTKPPKATRPTQTPKPSPTKPPKVIRPQPKRKKGSAKDEL